MKGGEYWFFMLLLFWGNVCFAQSKVSLFGKVVEAGSGEALVNAVVYWADKTQAATTNQYGHFILTRPIGQYDLQCSYSGYKDYKTSVALKQDTSMIIELEVTTLQEVVIRESPPVRQSGFLAIPVAQLKKIPTLLGEPDLLKALAMTPGIMTGQEGTSGLYVRGSTPDQNLVLLDEATVYNTSHAFGFLSVFNPDAVKNIDVYKGSFPARYGGRTASVIDLTMKEGNNQKKRAEFSLGVINSRFLVEGPIKKGHSSYMLSGRMMHTVLLQLPKHIKLLTGKPVQDMVSFWFYDINAKVNHTFKDKSQLFFSIYSNHDFFKNANQRSNRTQISTLQWGSLTSSLRYNRILSKRLFWRTIGTYSRFNYRLDTKETRQIGNESSLNKTNLNNSIRDWGVKTTFDYVPFSNYILRIGTEHTFHRYFPGQIKVILDNEPSNVSINQNTAIATKESAIYAENDLHIGNALKFNLGMRYSFLSVENQNYSNWEPRIALNWSLAKAHSIKMGYSRMQQYMHQLTSNGVGLPNDIWVPVTQKIPPISANQFEIGWYSTLDPNENWKLSIESYYKKMQNLIEYQYGSDIIVDYQKNWQDIIIKGVQGRAFGVELMLQKKQGKWNGWLSYTYAKSERRTRQINNGSWYDSRYDRRHNLALVANYQFASKWSLLANWVFQTGYPITLPLAAYIDFSGNVSPYYIGRNQGRMPNFHRLDLGAIYRNKNQKGREFGWNLGIYNAYNQRNPYYLEVIRNYKKIDQTATIDRLDVVKQAFFPLLPYFSYQIYY